MLSNLYSKGKQNILSLGVMSIIFVIVLILNLKTLYTADDYVYRFVYHTPSVSDHMQKITTGLIPYSMYNHYMNWNGRFVAHSVVQFFMQFDSKLPFDICNSLIYVLMIFFINKFAKNLSGKTKQTNAFILALIFFFTWFFIPSFGQAVHWVSGAGNYLWMCIIYLGFILFNLRNVKVNATSLILASVLGFLTGASNENSGPAAVLIVLLFMAKRYLEAKTFNWNSVIGVIFSGLGFVVMMLSPGTQHRGAVHRSVSMLLINGYDILRTTVHELGIAYLIFLVLFTVGLLYDKFSRDTFWSVLFFMTGHFAAIYIMVVSPEFPDRTFFGGVVFLAIATFIIVYAWFGEMKLPMFTLSVVAAGMFLFSFWGAYHDISSSYYQVSYQYQAIEQAKARVPKNARIAVMTPAMSKYNAYHGTIGLVDKPDAWMNVWISKFFGVDSISGYYQK